jgi:lysophospholipase L1-like esterase
MLIMNKRFIRLFEYGAMQVKYFNPASDEYMRGVIQELFVNDGWSIRTDSNGFILPEGSTSTDVCNNASILIGDSIVECLYMPENCRIESVLSSFNAEGIYLNAGYSGATSIDIINNIVNKIIPTQPKKVFLMSGVYDGICRSGFYKKINKSASIIDSDSPGYIGDVYRSRAAFLEASIKILQAHEIEVLVATFGHRHNPRDPYAEKYGLLSNDNYFCKINEVTRSTCFSAGINMIDFEKLMYDYFDFFYDNYHLTPKGARFVANTLREYNF